MIELERSQNGDRVVTLDTIRVVVINDYEVVVRGVAAMLAPYSARIEVVGTGTGGGPDVPGRRRPVRHVRRSPAHAGEGGGDGP